MKIRSLGYREYEGKPRYWEVSRFEVADIALFVGKNASGKSRMLSVMFGLARLISGQQREIFDSGSYEVSLESASGLFHYDLVLETGAVLFERLRLNGVVIFERNETGVGKIWAEGIGQALDFEVPSSVLVIQAKRDRVQHPQLELINQWASDVRHFNFGSSLGRDVLVPIPELVAQKGVGKQGNAGSVHTVYMDGCEKYGDAFDVAILRDMGLLGYDCSSVSLSPFDRLPQLSSIYVHEEGLLAPTSQVDMSQGMFRALAISIHLNYLIFEAKPRTLLLDDVGEGLDFDRSKAFIGLLVERAAKAGMQLLMTTNDRFVMNAVPLNLWGVVTRQGPTVSVTTAHEFPEVFEEFSHMGLSNFDFFARGLYQRERDQ